MYRKFNTYTEMSEYAAKLVIEQVNNNSQSVLGLATGSTPLGLYQKLIEENRNGKVDFSKVSSINLDEYCGLEKTHSQSYRNFMNNNLFDHINIDIRKTNVPNGLAEDIDEECKRYDKVIEDFGGADIQILGIGLDGHIGFNEPCEEFKKGTSYIKLDESTIEANARFFDNDISKVPTHAITMGIGGIMSAKKIIIMASGDKKRDIFEKARIGKITPQVQASILQFHKDVVWLFAEKN